MKTVNVIEKLTRFVNRILSALTAFPIEKGYSSVFYPLSNLQPTVRYGPVKMGDWLSTINETV